MEVERWPIRLDAYADLIASTIPVRIFLAEKLRGVQRLMDVTNQVKEPRQCDGPLLDGRLAPKDPLVLSQGGKNVDGIRRFGSDARRLTLRLKRQIDVMP